MSPFTLTTTLLSLILFTGFVLLGVFKFGLLNSYSAYATKWTESVRIHNSNLWSIITVIVAILLAPALIEQGEGNPWQSLGFFAPVYLIVVAMTPRWEIDRKQRRVHMSGAIICAAVSALWIVAVQHQFTTMLLSLMAAWALGILTKTTERAIIFWGEMVLFASVYVVLLT